MVEIASRMQFASTAGITSGALIKPGRSNVPGWQPKEGESRRGAKEGKLDTKPGDRHFSISWKASLCENTGQEESCSEG
jgi:hypothetical protein